MSDTLNIINRLFDKPVLDILTFVTHERFEPNLCATGHNFVSLTGPNVRSWNPKVSPVPSNYKIVKVDDWNNVQKFIPGWINFDLILVQNKFGHFPIAKQIANYLHLPILTIEHTDTMPNWPEEGIKQATSQYKGNVNCFITEYSKERWYSEDGIVVNHGINTDIWNPGNKERKNHILSVCNDWINRDLPCGFSLWKEVTKDLPVRVVGDTPGLSKGSESIEEQINEYQTSKIFLNTSQFSPLPMSLLEAMACGCAIVTSATGAIPEFLKHDVNALITNNPVKMRQYLERLLKSPRDCRVLGERAANLVEDLFPMNKFIDSYNNIFQMTRRLGYVG